MQGVYSDLNTTNTRLVASNAGLDKKIQALEGVDKELAKAQASIVATQEALNHSLIKQLHLMQQQQNPSFIPTGQTSRLSPNHPDPKKFNDDKTKLEAFITQLCIKLQQNADHYKRLGQNTKQNQLSYAISRLEGNAFTQVEPFVSRHGINL